MASALSGGNDTSIPKLALSPREAATAIGISERLMDQLIKDGKIPYCKINTRTLIPVDSLREYLRQGVEEQAANKKTAS